MAWAWACGCGVALMGLLAAEATGVSLGRWVCKPLASAAFVGSTWALGAADSAYGRMVLGAQLLGLLGDVLLIGSGTAPFVAGLAVFLAGHLAFTAALAGAAATAPALPVAAALACLLPAAVALHRWLLPHVPAPLRWPVRAYLLVISAMVASAAGAHSALQPAAIVGALLFYASDICVARERFVRPSRANALVGLPLYYAAQLLLGSSVQP